MDYETESESIPGTPEIHESIDDRVMRFLSNSLDYHIQHIFVNRNIFEVIDNRVPESFWDPVVVCLSEHQFSLVTNKLKKQDCVICNETKYNFKVVPCCKNDLCTCCASAWFGKSIKCPYCNQDIRDFI
jgi:hypothetical protein